MRILFLNPTFMGKFSRTSRSPAVTKSGTIYYPIWLAYAAGLAESKGHRVLLLDCPAENTELDALTKKLEAFSPELAVVETSTPSIYSDVKIAAGIKEKFSNAFVLLTGTHPSALPFETLSLAAGIDAVAIGEYDATVCDLADALVRNLPLDEVKGIAFRAAGTDVRTPEREKIEDLDSLPFVSAVYKKHLDYLNYFFAAANHPMIMIITGRGCPHRCFFCVYPQLIHGRRYRVRSAENVVAEFEYIMANFPDVREIGIEDDCFTADREHARSVCALLIEKKIRIRWYCNVRADVDYGLLKLMKQAGCRLVTVGFESFDQDILNGMNKGTRLDRYFRFAEDAKRAGLLLHGCIMFGNPGDTRESFIRNYEAAKKINCDSMQFYPLYVYPGTEAYAWAVRNKYLKTGDYSKWLKPDGSHACVLDIPGVDADEIESLCGRYLVRYHFRPRYIIKKIMQGVLDLSEGRRSASAALALVRNLFRKKD